MKSPLRRSKEREIVVSFFLKKVAVADDKGTPDTKKAAVPDDTTRALWSCRGAVMTRTRTKYFEAPHRRASQHAPKWVKCWDPAANDRQRTALMLQAANMAPVASRGKIAVTAAGWLDDIMHQHATYAAHIRSDHKSVFNYYRPSN